MTGAIIDTSMLSMMWQRQWPNCSKLPYELRGIRDQWVRFHTLPDSKRYPATDAEYQTIMARHNTVLTELVTGTTVLVVTVGYSDDAEPERPCRSPETVAAHPGAAYWTSACTDEESWIHLYVSEIPWTAGSLDTLLRHVADDVIANVLVADPDLRWLYHPYDGGMDVLLSSTTERDALRDRHLAWLSARPDGL